MYNSDSLCCVYIASRCNAYKILYAKPWDIFPPFSVAYNTHIELGYNIHSPKVVDRTRETVSNMHFRL